MPSIFQETITWSKETKGFEEGKKTLLKFWSIGQKKIIFEIPETVLLKYPEVE